MPPNFKAIARDYLATSIGFATDSQIERLSKLLEEAYTSGYERGYEDGGGPDRDLRG